MKNILKTIGYIVIAFLFTASLAKAAAFFANQVGTGPAASGQVLVSSSPTTAASWQTPTVYQTPLTFSTGLKNTAGTITVNISQNISTLSNLTSNGLIKTSGGIGTLSTATAGTDYIVPTSAFTAGSIAFGGASNQLTQNNAKFFWDNTNFRLGVGTATPSFAIDVLQNNAADSEVRMVNQASGKGSYFVTNANSNFSSYEMIGTSADWKFGMFGTVNFSVFDSTNTKTPFLITQNSASNTLVLTTTGITVGGSAAITSTSANSLVVGANGFTNPAFNVDSSTASAATGLNIFSKAAASGLALQTTSSGTNENLTLDAKGTGTLSLNTIGTGNVIIGNGFTSNLIGASANIFNGQVKIGYDSTTVPMIFAGAGTDTSSWLLTASGGRTMYGYTTTDTFGNEAMVFNAGGGKGIDFLTNGTNSSFLTGTYAMTILSNGNVGIGPTSPSTLLYASQSNPSSGAGYTTATIKNTSSTGRAEWALGTDESDFAGFVAMAGSATPFEAHEFDIGTSVNGALGMWTNNVQRVTITSSGQVGYGGITAPTADIMLPAGTQTASTAPLKFTSGSLLTTAEAGAFEFDGTAPYFTSSAGARGVLQATQMGVVASDFTMANSAVAQPAFPTTFDVWTLNATTTYKFEGAYYITTGATSHSTAMGFALGGSASITSIGYNVTSFTSAVASSTTTVNNEYIATNSSTVVVPANIITTTEIKFSGYIRMNVAGTVTPQITFSADPTGTILMKANSYINFTPVGSNTVTAVGNVG